MSTIIPTSDQDRDNLAATCLKVASSKNPPPGPPPDNPENKKPTAENRPPGGLIKTETLAFLTSCYEDYQETRRMLSNASADHKTALDERNKTIGRLSRFINREGISPGIKDYYRIPLAENRPKSPTTPEWLPQAKNLLEGDVVAKAKGFAGFQSDRRPASLYPLGAGRTGHAFTVDLPFAKDVIMKALFHVVDFNSPTKKRSRLWKKSISFIRPR